MMNKKRSSKLELSKYAFLLPLLILVAAKFTVSKAEGKIEKVSMVEKTDLAQLINKKAKYGEKGKHGVVEISLKKPQNPGNDTSSRKLQVLRMRGVTDSPDKALVIIDGKEMPIGFDVNSIDANTVYSVKALKDSSVTATYGEKAKNGVIIVTTKANHTSDTTKRKPSKAEVVKRVVIVGHSEKTTGENGQDSPQSTLEPIGGMKAFRRWIANNFVYPYDAIKARVKGTILTSFVVQTDGSLHDIRTLNDIGYGTSESAVALLQKAANWKPAMKEGKPIAVQYILPIRLDLTRR